VNPDFLSDYIKGLLHLSRQRTHSEDPIGDLTEVFLRQRRESNSDSGGSSEDESDDLPAHNVSDVLLSAARVFAEIGGTHTAASQGLCYFHVVMINLGRNYVWRESTVILLSFFSPRDKFEINVGLVIILLYILLTILYILDNSSTCKICPEPSLAPDLDIDQNCICKEEVCMRSIFITIK
jgi:hypothetical protein